MNTTQTESPRTETLIALRAEAGAAGDVAMVAIVDRALAGDVDALAECASVIEDARAQDPDDLGLVVEAV